MREQLSAFFALRHTNPALFWQRSLFWTFWFHMAFFAVGYGFREVMPILSLICLVMYYRYSWKESVLRTLPVKPLFASLWIMMFIGVAFSIDSWESFLEVGSSFNKGLILPFIAMECVKSLKDLKRLVAALVISFFWVGLSGIWQAITGFDFPMGYPTHAGRLTAAIGDYCVGNYLSLVLIPALGVWFIFRERFTFKKSLVLLCVVLAPGLFTLYGAAARSGLVALMAAALVWWALVMRFWRWKVLVPAVLVLGLAGLLLFHDASGRMSVQAFQDNGRWDLWDFALAILRTWPIFGAGADMYNTAFRSLGLVPTKDLITIEHPHNLYLDILCSSGLVGASFGFFFLFGMLWWLGRRLLPRLRAIADHFGENAAQEAQGSDADIPGRSSAYWQMTGLFALGYLAWLVNGVTGHEFYRMWWLAQAMQGLGVALGAIVMGERCEKEEGTEKS